MAEAAKKKQDARDKFNGLSEHLGGFDGMRNIVDKTLMALEVRMAAHVGNLWEQSCSKLTIDRPKSSLRSKNRCLSRRRTLMSSRSSRVYRNSTRHCRNALSSRASFRKWLNTSHPSPMARTASDFRAWPTEEQWDARILRSRGYRAFKTSFT